MTALDCDVIVIGGGLSGGLPAAAYLQKAGLQVLVVEANADPLQASPGPYGPAPAPCARVPSARRRR
jgi:glycine/D-amino acid oxidase-like deaminating enzyme